MVIDLGPFIDNVKETLSAQGFTLIDRLPPIHPTFVLFKSADLSKAQTAYRLVNRLKFVLPVLCLLCLVLGIYVARRHRRALLAASNSTVSALPRLATLPFDPDYKLMATFNAAVDGTSMSQGGLARIPHVSFRPTDPWGSAGRRAMARTAPAGLARRRARLLARNAGWTLD